MSIATESYLNLHMLQHTALQRQKRIWYSRALAWTPTVVGTSMSNLKFSTQLMFHQSFVSFATDWRAWSYLSIGSNS